jgi:hypothetical protein
MKMRSQSLKIASLISAFAALCALCGLAQNESDPLLRGFFNPPDSAKARVWWHWMNGNVSKEGIKADLEWMKRAGIGGFQNFNAGMRTPNVVEKRLVYMTPEWKDAFKYAATVADQLGLEMAIASSPGWSESGGPWVKPEQAMKKFVWTETRVEGGKPFSGKLPEPSHEVGPFQNISGGGNGLEAVNGETRRGDSWYADAAVIAFRLPDGDKSMAELQPKLTSSGGNFTLAGLVDGDYAKTVLLTAAALGEKSWLQFEFAAPQTVYGMSLFTGTAGRGGGPGGGGPSNQALEASANGSDFRVVASFPGGARTISFAPVTAKFFRFTVLAQSPPANVGRAGARMGGGAVMGTRGATPAPAGTQIAEFALHTSARVNRLEEKAAFTSANGVGNMPTPSFPSASAVRKTDVIDLTAQMRPDGTLNWNPPAGNWCVLRLGYSLIGTTNRPASPEATGLEADKLSKKHMTVYFEYYLNQYKDATGGLMGKRGLQYVLNDSWEAGQANWTDEMIAEFTRRRGYDMKPWLPVLAGHAVESSEASDRFLWDFRKTIAELTAANNYDLLGDMLKERGMGRYSEGHETSRVYIADGMEVKRNATVPMSAMWAVGPQGGSPWGGAMNPGGFQQSYASDLQESASVAHIYGQNIVAAESFTASNGPYIWTPELLKPTADAELAHGLNRFVVHTSAHQPTDQAPGLSLGGVGQWFTRHETWAEVATPWTTYLARSSYMLQQGEFGADLLYYYGEDANISGLFGQAPPALPEGYGFDYANSDVVANRLTISGNRLNTATGMSYRLLVLDKNAQRMPLAVLRKIRDYVNSGAAVVGPKPTESPSLMDDQTEYRRIADDLWGAGSGQRTVGKGMVFAGMSAAEAVKALQLPPDFEYTKPQSDTILMFVHRRVSDGEIYWVNNRRKRDENVEGTFRVADKTPEIWHADTGVIEPASYRTVNGRTVVPLRLNENDAIFIIFRKPATVPSRTVAEMKETQLAVVEGAWEVAFQPNRGAPAKTIFDKLASWTESSDAGIKYFSGIATYTKAIQASAGWFMSGEQIWLDLGDVQNIADVTVNGKQMAAVWRKPFRVNLTGAFKAGANTVEVKVTNVWVNRLIGDQQPDAQKITYTPQQPYRADSPLLPSGLLGPVRVVSLAR